jgi:hypothetical protein
VKQRLGPSFSGETEPQNGTPHYVSLSGRRDSNPRPPEPHSAQGDWQKRQLAEISRTSERRRRSLLAGKPGFAGRNGPPNGTPTSRFGRSASSLAPDRGDRPALSHWSVDVDTTTAPVEQVLLHSPLKSTRSRELSKKVAPVSPTDTNLSSAVYPPKPFLRSQNHKRRGLAGH